MDGRRSNSAQIAFNYAQQIVMQFAAGHNGKTVTTSLLSRHLYNPNLEYHWFVLPSLVVLITTVGCLMVTALSLAREKEEGTFDQLLVTPLTHAYIMVGKAVPAICVAMVQGMIIAAAAVWIFQVPYTGSVPLLFLSMFCYGLSLVGFGFLISSVCDTQQQAFLGAFCFIAPAVVLSGYLAPVENMPFLLRMMSMADPLTHFIEITKGLFLKNYGFSQIWPNLWPLLVIAVATTLSAYILFRRRSTQ